MQILHVVGARPNFMKVAPVYRALSGRPDVTQVIVHTGQHYDFNMSDVFFQELDIPEPDYYLAVGSGTHAAQTAEIMLRFESIAVEHKPDWVVVYGDVNSTIAAAMVCSKLQLPVAHVEAGLRSFDRSMPEEINRLLTDQLADLLFTPSDDGNQNLQREGISPEKVHLVGNVMIDTLIRFAKSSAAKLPASTPKDYVLVTLHRPSNVDDTGWLLQIVDQLESISRTVPVVFPVHPRTRKRLLEANYEPAPGSAMHFLDPAPYLEFLALQKHAMVVVTDSGGIQEETTYLGVPCLTLRENTERPITVSVGTNKLIGHDLAMLKSEVEAVVAGNGKKGKIPALWDGAAGVRIADVLTGTVGLPRMESAMGAHARLTKS